MSTRQAALELRRGGGVERHRQTGDFAVVAAAAHLAVAVEPGDRGAVAQRHRRLRALRRAGRGNRRSPRGAGRRPRRSGPRPDIGGPARRRWRSGSAGVRRASSGSASILFSASMSGVPPPSSIAPSSRSTVSTSARCCSRVGMGDVAHMHDQVGLDHLFQRGAEGGDQMGRQVGDEADRVGDHAAPCRWAA